MLADPQTEPICMRQMQHFKPFGRSLVTKPVTREFYKDFFLRIGICGRTFAMAAVA